METEMTPGDEYLAEVLALDPSVEAANIIARRREHLSSGGRGRKAGKARKPLAALPLVGRPDRQAAESSLGEVHDSFWSTQGNSVRTRLEGFDLNEFPDLQRYRQRLLRVNDLRSEFNAFEEDTRVDRQFASTLGAVLIAPEHRAAELRQRHVNLSASASFWSKSRRSAKVLAKYSGLHTLESSWCDRIRNARKDRQDSRTINKRTGAWFILAWFTVKLLLKWFRD